MSAIDTIDSFTALTLTVCIKCAWKIEIFKHDWDNHRPQIAG